MNQNSKERRIIVKFLYQFNFQQFPIDLEDGSVDERELSLLLDQFYLTLEKEEVGHNLKFHIESAKNIIKKIIQLNSTLETTIAKNSLKWSLDKITKIDLTILKVATFEILYRKEIPPKVAINEALHLASEFSGEKSTSFINGVLDSIYKDNEKNQWA